MPRLPWPTCHLLLSKPLRVIEYIPDPVVARSTFPLSTFFILKSGRSLLQAMAFFTYSVMTILCAVLLCHIHFARGSLQYCHENAQVPVHFCFAVETWRNTSTSATDLLVTLGYQRVFDGGWTAVGIGSGMFGALMFVEYAGEGRSESPYPAYPHGNLVTSSAIALFTNPYTL